MAGGELDITQGYPRIECRHYEARPLADGANPAVRRAPVESLAVA